MARCRSRRLTLIAVACLTLMGGAAAGGASLVARPGSPVASFGKRGLVLLAPGTRLLAVAVQRNGDVVATGETGLPKHVHVLLARFTPGGRLDRSFGRDGLVVGPAVPTSHGSGSIGRAVALAPGGKIVVVGKATSGDGTARNGLLVERFNSNGALDRHFGRHGVVNLLTGSFGDGYGVAVTSRGEVIATGSDDALGSDHAVFPRVAVVRLSPSGSPERTFASGGIDVLDLGPYSYALAVALAPAGKIVIAGSQSPGLQATNGLVARLTSNGRLDRSFAGSGTVARQFAPAGAYSAFNAVAVRSNGQIVAAGASTGPGSTADAIVARFNSSGSPDRSFGSGGLAVATAATGYLAGASAVPGATGVLLNRSGGLLAVGQSRTGAVSNLALWEFTSHGRLAGNFGSGGEAKLLTTAESEAAGVALGPDGSAYVAGDENQLGQSYRGLLARYAS